MYVRHASYRDAQCVPHTTPLAPPVPPLRGSRTITAVLLSRLLFHLISIAPVHAVARPANLRLSYFQCRHCPYHSFIYSLDHNVVSPSQCSLLRHHGDLASTLLYPPIPFSSSFPSCGFDNLPHPLRQMKLKGICGRLPHIRGSLICSYILLQ